MAGKKEVEKKPGRIWMIIIISLAVLGLVIITAVVMSGGFDGGIGNIAQIEIKGVIKGDGGGNILGGPVTASKDVVDLIKKAEKNSFIKAIIIEINSPGGSAVASAEIAEAVKNAKKPVVAVIREIGASGGYWIASASDRIFANRLSMTGSIGVIGSYLEFAGLIERYNITYRRMVAGKYKDTGNPYKRLTPEEEELYQQKLDKLYETFIEEVSINRRLDKKRVAELATGFVYLGSEAKEYGLIDEFGGVKEAESYLESLLKTKVKTVLYKRKATLSEILAGVLSQELHSIGVGIGEGLFNSVDMNSYPEPLI